MRQFVSFVLIFVFSFISVHGSFISFSSLHAGFNLEEDLDEEPAPKKNEEEPSKSSKSDDFDDEPVKSSEKSTSSSDSFDDEKPVNKPVKKSAAAASETNGSPKMATLFLFADSYSANKGGTMIKSAVNYINGLNRYNLTDTEMRLFSPSYSSDKVDFDEAQKIFDKAKAAYDDLNMEEAISGFERAKSIYERHIDRTNDMTMLSKTLLYLGAANKMIDQDDKAKPYMIGYINLNPDTALDEMVFSPEVIGFYDKVKEDMLLLPSGSLSFKSEPAQALVFVDGKLAGITPFRMDGINEGKHYYRIHRNGYKDVGGVSKIRDKDEKEVSETLRKHSEAEFLEDYEKKMTENFGRVAMLNLVAETGTKFGVDKMFVMYAAIENEKVELKAILLDVKKKSYKDEKMSFTAPSDFDFSKGDDMNTLFDGMFGDEYGFNPIGTKDSVEESSSSKKDGDESIVKKWWFWTIIGAVAAGGLGTGMYFLLSPADAKKATLELNFSK